MRKYFETMQDRIDAVLEASREQGEAIESYRAIIKVLEQGIKEMRSDLGAHPFKDKSAEIVHYKYEVPKIYGLLFFYIKLVEIEGARAFHNVDKFRELLRGKLAEAEIFFEKRTRFCQYYHQKSIYRDEYLFARKVAAVEEPGAFISEEFTKGAYLASWLLAYERLRNWVVAEMDSVRGVGSEFLRKKLLLCVARPVEVVEVFKALHLAGWFGETPFIEVIEWANDHLGANVGMADQILQELADRKINRTKFLDGMKKGLAEWSDEKL